MPTRYLRPGIRDSEVIDALSPLAETLFYRLLVTVDDFGRADARASMVKAACFPIKDSVTAAKCADLLRELDKNGLVHIYEHDGKPYMQMRKWENAPRASKSKFPEPVGGGGHLHTTVCNPHTVLPVTVTGTDNREPITETDNREPGAEQRASTFAEFWAAYPKKVGKGDAERAWKKVSGPAAVLALITEALRWQRVSDQWLKDGGQYVPNPATYINQRRWEDEPQEQHARKDAPRPQALSFRERDKELARDKYEEIFGKPHPDRAPAPTIIDVTPTQTLLDAS